MNIPEVYKAIALITGEMAKEGISKDRKNVQQGYSFRGIDDVYGAIAPKLAAHGLCILPRVVSREVIERTNSKGNALFYTTLTVEFDFVSSNDGSKHTICTVGEAMDSGDKSANKAMSAAYKYAALQTFCIPTEGDNDADAQTHEVSSKPELDPSNKSEWEAAKKRFIKDGNLKAVLAQRTVSRENQEKLMKECSEGDIPQ